MKPFLSFLACLAAFGLSAQNQKRLDALASEFTQKSFPELKEVLSIPNDAFYPEWIEKNVRWSEDRFSQRGFSTQRITTKGAPLLLASQKFEGAKSTVLVYLQTDGQPVDPSQWAQKDPYKPVLKREKEDGVWETIDWSALKNYKDDWRIFARSASDAKGSVAMFLVAMDALEKTGKTPNFNLKVILDFEEEMGSCL